MFIYDINHGKDLDYSVFRTFNTGSYYGDICATRQYLGGAECSEYGKKVFGSAVDTRL